METNKTKPRAESVSEGAWEIWEKIFPNIIEPKDVIKHILFGEGFFPNLRKEKIGEETTRAIIAEKKFQELIVLMHNNHPEPLFLFSARLVWLLEKNFWEAGFKPGIRLARKTRIFLHFCQGGAIEGFEEEFSLVKQSCLNLATTGKLKKEIASNLLWLREFAETDPLVLAISCRDFIDKKLKIGNANLLLVIADWFIMSLSTQKQNQMMPN